MGWFNILKVNPITERDKKEFAKLKEELKKEMGNENFSKVEGKGLLDLERWINGNISSPDEITSDVHPPKIVRDSVIMMAKHNFDEAVLELYEQNAPEKVQTILIDMQPLVHKLAEFYDWI